MEQKPEFVTLAQGGRLRTKLEKDQKRGSRQTDNVPKKKKRKKEKTPRRTSKERSLRSGQRNQHQNRFKKSCKIPELLGAPYKKVQKGGGARQSKNGVNGKTAPSKKRAGSQKKSE